MPRFSSATTVQNPHGQRFALRPDFSVRPPRSCSTWRPLFTPAERYAVAASAASAVEFEHVHAEEAVGRRPRVRTSHAQRDSRRRRVARSPPRRGRRSSTSRGDARERDRDRLPRSDRCAGVRSGKRLARPHATLVSAGSRCSSADATPLMSTFGKRLVGFLLARPLIAILIAAAVVGVLLLTQTRRQKTPVTHRQERVALTDAQQMQLLLRPRWHPPTTPHKGVDDEFEHRCASGATDA